MSELFLNAARGLLRRPYLLPFSIVTVLRSFVRKSENAFVLRRAATWKLDARGRIEWIDGMHEMIQQAKKSYNENIR